MQKYGHLANAVPQAQGFECIICGSNPTRWTWSDQHGEAMCVQCGTPYQLLQRNEEGNLLDVSPSINIKVEWIPVLVQYWCETEQFTGLGTIMIAREYPECVKGQRLFDEWLRGHQNLIPA